MGISDGTDYTCLWSIVILARPLYFVTRFEFFSVSIALVLCVSLRAILCSITFLIPRDLHHAASENLWLNPVFAASVRFSQESGVEDRATSVKIDALALIPGSSKFLGQ